MTDSLILTLGVLSYAVLWATTLGAFKPLSIERSGVYILVTGLGAGLVFGVSRFVDDGSVFQALGLMLAESAYLALVLFLRSVRMELSRRSEIRGSIVVLVLTMVHLTLNMTLQGVWHYVVMATQILVLFSLALREAVLVYRNRPNGIAKMLVVLLTLHLVLEALGRAYMGYQFIVYPDGTGTEWLQARAAWIYITFSLGYVVLTATASVLMDAFRTDKFRLEQVVQQVEARLREKESSLLSMLITNALRDNDPTVASLAHELRQPLTAIQLNAEYLASGKRVSPQEEAQVLQAILRENQRAAAIVQNVRSLFAAKKPQEKERLHLSRWITHWVHELAPALMEKSGVVLQVRVDAEPVVLINPAQLEIVLQNLVNNAVEAMAGRQNGRIDIVMDVGSMALVDVIDNGPGVPPELEEKVFEMNYSTKPQGMGFGLWLCRHIAKSHGGYLETVPSSQGGHMRLTLPNAFH